MDNSEVQAVLKRNITKAKLATVLKDFQACRALSDFLKTQNSAHIVEAWQAIEQLKKTPNFREIQQKAADIYAKYFAKGAASEVTVIDEKVRRELDVKIKSPDLTTYGDVQAAIFNYMTNEIYPLFVNSEEYRKYKENASRPPSQPSSPVGTWKLSPSSSPMNTRRGPPVAAKMAKGSPPPSVPTSPTLSRPPIPTAWSPFRDSTFKEPQSSSTNNNSKEPESPPSTTTSSSSNGGNAKSPTSSRLLSASASFIESPVEDFVGQLPNLELTKQRTNHLAVLEEYLDEFVSDSPALPGPFVCHVHIKADIDAWRVVSFTESTTVRQALQHITHILNLLLNGKRNWDKYMLVLRGGNHNASGTGSGGSIGSSSGSGIKSGVHASAADQTKLLVKDYGLKPYDSIEFVSVRKEPPVVSFPGLLPTSISNAEEWDKSRDLEKEVNEIRSILLMSALQPQQRERVVAILDEAHQKYRHGRQMLDSAFLAVYQLDDHVKKLYAQNQVQKSQLLQLKKQNEQEPDTALIQSLQNQVKQLEEEANTLKRDKKSLENEKEILAWCIENEKAAKLVPVKPAVAEAETQTDPLPSPPPSPTLTPSPSREAVPAEAVTSTTSDASNATTVTPPATTQNGAPPPPPRSSKPAPPPRKLRNSKDNLPPVDPAGHATGTTAPSDSRRGWIGYSPAGLSASTPSLMGSASAPSVSGATDSPRKERSVTVMVDGSVIGNRAYLRTPVHTMSPTRPIAPQSSDGVPPTPPPSSTTTPHASYRPHAQITADEVEKQLTPKLKACHVDFLEALKNGEDCRRFLLAGDIHVNYRDENGFTALHWAVRTGNMDMLTALLEQPGIDVNATDFGGWTPLHYASHAGFNDIVEVLLRQKEIDVDKKTNNKKKAKHVAKTREIQQLIRDKKHQLKKETEKVAQRRKSQLAQLRKLPTYRNTLKKKNVSHNSLEQLLGAPCYRKGLLQIFSDGKWKDRWVSLTKDCIIVDFPEVRVKQIKRSASDTDLKSLRKEGANNNNEFIIMLEDIIEISNKELANNKEFAPFDQDPSEGYVFGVFMPGLRPCYFRTPTRPEMARWMLAVDGLVVMKLSNSAMNGIGKNSLLGILFNEDKNRGGKIKSHSNGEKWLYEEDGILRSDNGLYEYKWNGKILSPRNPNTTPFGLGVWDGLTIQWFINTDKNSAASSVYVWNDVEKTFQDSQMIIDYEDNYNCLTAKRVGVDDDEDEHITPVPKERKRVPSIVLHPNPWLVEEYKIEGLVPMPVAMFVPLFYKARIFLYKYEMIDKILLMHRNEFIATLNDCVNVNKADQLAQALVNVFEHHNETVDMINFFITREVQLAGETGTLFRSNSLASKLVKFYLRLIGSKYIKTLFTELIKQINDMTFEIDPVKLEEGESLEENFQNLLRVTQQFLDVIINSKNICPRPILCICNHLGRTVRAKFPEHYLIAIGGLLFLRYLCPAILQPSSFNILDETFLQSPNAKRGLLLIAKILQNLSNEILFKQQEEYMMGINEFIKKNIPVLREFFQQIVDGDYTMRDTQPVAIPKDTFIDSLSVIYECLDQNFSTIEKGMATNEVLLQMVKDVLSDDVPKAFFEQQNQLQKEMNKAEEGTLVSATVKGRIEDYHLLSFDEFKDKLALIAEDRSSLLVSVILKEYEQDGKLRFAFSHLIEEDPNMFNVTAITLDTHSNENQTKFGIVDKIRQSNFITVDSSEWSHEQWEDALLDMPKETALELANYILSQCESDGRLRQLLDEAYHIHSSKRFLFAFLLTLAATNTEHIQGLHKISYHLSRWSDLDRRKASLSKTLLESTVEELQTKQDFARQQEAEAAARDDQTDLMYYKREVETLEQEIQSLKDAFPFKSNRNSTSQSNLLSITSIAIPDNDANNNNNNLNNNSSETENEISPPTGRFPSFRKMSGVSKRVSIRNLQHSLVESQTFTCYQCKKPLQEGYVVHKGHEYCRSCTYSN